MTPPKEKLEEMLLNLEDRIGLSDFYSKIEAILAKGNK